MSPRDVRSPGGSVGRPRVRLQDIAEATGFSVNTVSLALRGSPRIGGDARRRIEVDGVLVFPADHADMGHLDRASEAGLPIILLSQVETPALDVVTVDDRVGAWKAVGHLIARGHRRILMLDGGSDLHYSAKRDGARRAIREAGLPPDVLTIRRPTGNSAAAGFAAMEGVLPSPAPTAVFTSTDALAIGVLRWCGIHGLSVPGDLAVMGYDDTETGAYCAPPLSTIHYAADIVASLAVDRLIEAFGYTSKRPAQLCRLIEPELVCRATT